MNTTPPFPGFAPELPAAADVSPPPAEPATVTGLFAEIVFDRPLDTAYSYAVPESLREAIAVGKRVEAPFGRGDTATVGYCVGLRTRGPDRAVKPLFRVLDEEVLLTDDLLRLTRWMADYYLCGWGQVLQAILPAGVRDRKGQRPAVFLEAVPEGELPDPLPTLTAKQAAGLDWLREAGGPVELRHLARMAQSGPGPLLVLVGKGLARRTVRRVEASREHERPEDQT